MSVYHRGSIYHYEFRLRGKPYRGTTGQTNRREAEKFEGLKKKEILAELERLDRGEATEAAPRNVTLAFATERYLADNHNVSELRKKNVARVRDILGPDVEIAKITDEAIHSLVEGEQIKHLICTWRQPVALEDLLRELNDDRFPVTPGQTLTLAERSVYLQQAEADSGSEPLYRRVGDKWMVQSTVADPQASMSNTNIRQAIIDPIFAVMTYARDDLHVVFNRFPKRQRHQYPSKWRLNVLSDEQQIELLLHTDQDLKDLTEFGIFSMVRSDNLLNLTFEQVNGGYLSLIQKGDKPFERFINTNMLNIIERRRDLGTEHVFTRLNQSPGKEGERIPWNRSSKNRAFSRACEDAGIVDLRFHDLRRTGATRMFDAGGGDIEAVRAALGHCHSKVTWQYIGRDPVRVETAEVYREARDEVVAMLLGAKGRGEPVDALTPGEQRALIEVAVKARVAKTLRTANERANSLYRQLVLPDEQPLIIDMTPNEPRSSYRPLRSIDLFTPSFVKYILVPSRVTAYLYVPFEGAKVTFLQVDADDRLHLRVERGDFESPILPVLDLSDIANLEALLASGPAMVRSDEIIVLMRNLSDLEDFKDLAQRWDHELCGFALVLHADKSAVLRQLMPVQVRSTT